MVVEHDDGLWQWAATGLLEAAGYEVACCGGPHELPDGRCPLVAGGHCPLVDGADLIVSGLGISQPAERAVLVALRTRHEQVPVLVEIPAREISELHAVAPGCRTVPWPVCAKDLKAAVDDVLRRHR